MNLDSLFNVTNKHNINNCISDKRTREEANIFIFKGKSVREMHKKERGTKSFKSGTIDEIDIAGGICSPKIIFFGEHIREAIQTIKSYLKK